MSLCDACWHANAVLCTDLGGGGGGTVSGTLDTLNTTPATTGSATAAAGDEDFDMFAQSRQSFEQNKAALHSPQGSVSIV